VTTSALNLTRAARQVADALLAPADPRLSAYDPARHEEQLLTLLEQPARERDPSARPNRNATRSALIQALASSDEVVLVAERERRLVAGLWLRAALLDSRLTFHVLEIVLAPELRNHGLGTVLLERAERAAADCGGVAVTLDYMANNTRVAGFYRRLGYELAGHDLRSGGWQGRTSLEHSVWSYRPATDAAFVVDSLRSQLRQHPLRCDAAIAELESLTVPESRFVLVAGTKDERPLGVVWFERQRSRSSGAPLAIVLALAASENRVIVSADLLTAAQRESSNDSVAEILATTWGNHSETRDTLVQLGFSLGRLKLCKWLQR
jgi:ribosomal protein S18 acetylase RimI-like enzyme